MNITSSIPNITFSISSLGGSLATGDSQLHSPLFHLQASAFWNFGMFAEL